MTKFNLTDETVKVGDLKLDKSQFDIPKKVTILSSRVAPVYKNVNGESIATDEVAKITCSVQDTDKIQALKDLGYSPDDLKGIRLEIVENLDKLAKSVEKDELNSLVVELINPEVHLGWRANNNGGGNWGGLKLVATDIKFIGA
ncbi:hypothetical protein BOVMAS02_13440 [Streptococcus uberis]